jgi:2-hydroxychromene-2-carboxylate isomerase
MTASGDGTIDFWFTPGSTYTYLTVMRLGDVARTNNVRFTWRPFDLRTILLERSLGRPFVGKPVKLAYMWRDIERRAPMYGLNPVLPAPYPLQEWET